MNKTYFAVVGGMFGLLLLVFSLSGGFTSPGNLVHDKSQARSSGYLPRPAPKEERVADIGAQFDANAAVPLSAASAPQTPVDAPPPSSAGATPLRLPLALVAVDQAAHQDESRTKLLLQLGDQFLHDTETLPNEQAAGRPSWQSLQAASDAKFELFFGADSFQRQQYLRARQEQDGASATLRQP